MKYYVGQLEEVDNSDVMVIRQSEIIEDNEKQFQIRYFVFNSRFGINQIDFYYQIIDNMAVIFVELPQAEPYAIYVESAKKAFDDYWQSLLDGDIDEDSDFDFVVTHYQGYSSLDLLEYAKKELQSSNVEASKLNITEYNGKQWIGFQIRLRQNNNWYQVYYDARFNK